jgi:hypothetical protein
VRVVTGTGATVWIDVRIKEFLICGGIVTTVRGAVVTSASSPVGAASSSVGDVSAAAAAAVGATV